MEANEAEQPDREAMLMLYAGGEMLPEQRAAFEAQLTSEPALAEELKRLLAAMESVEKSVGALDDHQRLPVNPAVAIRRAERAMQQWAMARLRPPESQPLQARRMPWWSYPMTAAAVLIVSFVIWSNRQPIKPLPAVGDFQSTYMVTEAEALADRLDAQFGPIEVASDEVNRLATEELDLFFLHPSEVATW
jgi:anti-sigma factor RsiW